MAKPEWPEEDRERVRQYMRVHCHTSWQTAMPRECDNVLDLLAGLRQGDLAEIGEGCDRDCGRLGSPSPRDMGQEHWGNCAVAIRARIKAKPLLPSDGPPAESKET